MKNKNQFLEGNISSLLLETSPPVIHMINSTLRELRKRGIKIYDYGQALINILPPSSVLDFLSSQKWTDPNLYTICPVPGLETLRAQIAKERQGVFKEKINANNVIVTCGANHATIMALKAVTSPDDSVALFSPYFFNHLMAIQIEALNAKFLSLNDNMEIDFDEIESEWQPNTRALLLSSPLNPIGKSLTSSDLIRLSSFVNEKGATLILDETYFEFQHSQMRSLYHNESTILVGSFSKSLCLAGMRIGYLIAPENLINEIFKLQDTILISPSTIGQLCVDIGLGEKKDFTSKIKLELKKRNKTLVEGLMAMNFFTEFHGDIDLFCFTKLPGKINDVMFAESLLKHEQIAVMPGNVSGRKGVGYIRWSIGSITNNDIEESLPIIRKFISQYSS